MNRYLATAVLTFGFIYGTGLVTYLILTLTR